MVTTPGRSTAAYTPARCWCLRSSSFISSGSGSVVSGSSDANRQRGSRSVTRTTAEPTRSVSPASPSLRKRRARPPGKD